MSSINPVNAQELVVHPSYSLLDMPHEIIINILRFLPLNELANVSLVSKALKQLADDDSLWKYFVIRDFFNAPKIKSTYKETYQSVLHLETPNSIHERYHKFSIRTGIPFSNIAFIKNGHFITGSYDSTITRWDAEGERSIPFYSLPFTNNCVHVLLPFNNEESLIAGYKDGKIRIINLKTDECVQILEGHSDITSIKLSKDERWLSVRCKPFPMDVRFNQPQVNEHQIKTWDLQTYKCINTFDSAEGERFVLVKDNEMFISYLGQQLRFRDVKTGQTIKTFTLGKDSAPAINKVFYVNSGKQFITVDVDDTVKIWDSNTGNCDYSFPNPSANASAKREMFLSEDENCLSYVTDGDIQIRDLKTGKFVTLRENQFPKNYCPLAYTKEGKFVLASPPSRTDNETIIYDFAASEENIFFGLAAEFVNLSPEDHAKQQVTMDRFLQLSADAKEEIYVELDRFLKDNPSLTHLRGELAFADAASDNISKLNLARAHAILSYLGIKTKVSLEEGTIVLDEDEIAETENSEESGESFIEEMEETANGGLAE